MGMFQNVVQAVKGGAGKVAAGSALVLGMGAQAHAALPQEITDVFSEATGNGKDIGWIVLGLLAAIMAFKFIRRAL